MVNDQQSFLATAFSLISATILLGQSMNDVRVKTAKIEHGELSVLFQDNSESPKPKLSGVQSLFNVKHSPGYDAYDPDLPGSGAGLNFEHIITGHEGRYNAFTPRYGRYDLYRMDDGKSVKLVRKAEDSPWKMASTMTYTVVEPYYIDMKFTCTPQDAKLFGTRNSAIFFWADYMNQVKDVALHFRGVEKPGGKETWIRAEALKGEYPHWNGGGTYRHIDAPPIEYDKDLKFNLNSWSYDWPRFAKPFYFGLADNGMVFIIMFDRTYNPTDQVRFSLFKFKCHDDVRKPAWDFQYVINRVETGRQYGYRARVAWKKFISPKDCLDEYEKWITRLPASKPKR
jgi:hypothetical protein